MSVEVRESSLGWAESQFEPAVRVVPGRRHVVGACSIRNFPRYPQPYPQLPPLAHAHEEVRGFLEWFEHQGAAPTFWLRDGQVQTWVYEPGHGSGQRHVTIDDDCVFYHSGHGKMTDDGVFLVPMGGFWKDRFFVGSTDLSIGEHACRYLFWSACRSLRVLEGHTPMRTWGTANKGIRMMFGFESPSLDSPEYGRRFASWCDAGASFRMSWLNACASICTEQIPTVAACGAERDEALDRLYHERRFGTGQVGRRWWAWSWLEPGRLERARTTQIPQQLVTARLAPVDASLARDTAGRFGFDGSRVRQHRAGISIADGDRQLAMRLDGRVVVQVAAFDQVNRTAITLPDAARIAASALRGYGLGAQGTVVLDRIARINDGCGTGDGEVEQWQSGVLVRFRQLINGVPVVTPHAGTVDFVVDNSGSVVSVCSTVRAVEALHDGHRDSPVGGPPPTDSEASGLLDTALDERDTLAVEPERLLRRALSDRLRDTAVVHAPPSSAGAPHTAAAPHATGVPQVGALPQTAEIGYDVQGNRAVLVAQRTVWMDHGDGVRRLHLVKAPITV